MRKDPRHHHDAHAEPGRSTSLDAGTALLATGVGAGLMYLFDPRLGNRRRAVTRDKLLRFARDVGRAGNVAARDLLHRTQGSYAQVRSTFDHRPVSDDTLAQRVRAKLGRLVAEPRAVHVHAVGGIVMLSGPVRPEEFDALITAVRHIPGVQGIDNDLDVPIGSEDQPMQQSAAPRRRAPVASTGERLDLMQENWSPATRLLATAGGAWIAAKGMARGGLFIGPLAAVGGFGLLLRGLTNLDVKRLTGFAAGRRAVQVRKTVNIRRDIGEVFGFFSRYDSFPLLMRNVRSVRDDGDGRSHWTVAGPAGVPVKWDAQLTDYVPHRRIAWESLPGAVVANAGAIRFAENPDGSTRVDVQLSYNPPAGAIGHALATLFGADPRSEMDADLARLKTLIETAHIPHDAAVKPASAVT